MTNEKFAIEKPSHPLSFDEAFQLLKNSPEMNNLLDKLADK